MRKFLGNNTCCIVHKPVFVYAYHLTKLLIVILHLKLKILIMQVNDTVQNKNHQQGQTIINKFQRKVIK
jgi:hypothetical protein